ncbi:MAG: transglycosylase domain-containing protein [Acidobacteriota bacterium]
MKGRPRLPRLRLRLLARAAAGVGAAAALGLGIAGFLRSDLESPGASLLVLDRHGEPLGELPSDPDGRHGFWPLDSVPSRVAAATVAVEDRRFWRHPGVDPKAVARALAQNARSGRRISGASTLAMQVARLQRPGPRTYGRKALEATTALWMVARHGRRRVLEHYLQVVPYGNQSHGIAHAARRYFDKPVVDLSWAETALLSAIPQAPARMNLHDPRGRARAVRRGLQILDLLGAEGVLGGEELRLARRQIVRLRVPPRPRRPESALHVLMRLRAARPAGEWGPAPTTLDLELQREVSWLAARHLEGLRPRGAGNLAALVVRLEDLTVHAALGSADFFDQRYAGALDYTAVARSSGSTLKPFFYAQALDRGLLDTTRVLDDLRRGAGGIGNSDGRFLGPLLPRFALGNSRNVPAADLLERLGLGEGFSLLGRLGLHGGGGGSAERYGLGLTIGSLAVTPEALAAAYGALASDGLWRPLRWRPGEPAAPAVRAMSEDAARIVTQFLADPQARLPSFPRSGALELPFPVAAKTGTSSRYRDAWTVAYTPRWLVVVWVGDPDHQPMHGLSGYRAAAPLATQILRHLHPEAADGLEVEGFTPPRDHERAKTCVLTGAAAGPACDRTSFEWRPRGAAPQRACRAHRLLAVDARSGRPADFETPREHLELRTFTELPARYAAWQAAAGLPRPPGAALMRSPAGPLLPARALAPRRATRLEVISPRDGLHVFLDPETPAERSTLALSLVADPPPEQILWRVNGEPYALSDYPFEERWRLEPGDHTIVAEVPWTGVRSAPVHLKVE